MGEADGIYSDGNVSSTNRTSALSMLAPFLLNEFAVAMGTEVYIWLLIVLLDPTPIVHVVGAPLLLIYTGVLEEPIDEPLTFFRKSVALQEVNVPDELIYNGVPLPPMPDFDHLATTVGTELGPIGTVLVNRM